MSEVVTQENNPVADEYNPDALDNDRCATCERLGQFLPVRIAIGFAQGGERFAAPSELTAGFPQLPKGLLYVLRRLNQGYIYCYSSAWKTAHFNDDGIRTYQVNDLGYLTAIDKDNLQADFKDKNYTCFRQALTSKGANINSAFLLDCLVQQEVNPNVNIAYSRHQWSPETCNNLSQNESIRSKVMPSFHVKDGADFVIKKDKYKDVVENYTEPTPAQVTIPWEADLVEIMQTAPFQPPKYFTGEDSPIFDSYDIVTDAQGEKQIKWHNKEVPYKVSDEKRVIVLNDPVGITEDLVHIVNYLAEKLRTPEEERQYQSAINIIKVQSWMKAKIHAEEYYTLRSNYALAKATQRMAQSDELKNFMRHAQSGSSRNNDQIERDYDAATDKMNRLTREELENFHDFRIEDVERLTRTIDAQFEEEWTKERLLGFEDSYSEKLRESAMVSWLQQQQQKVKDYTSNTLNPILACYIEWLKSDILLDYMDQFFDHKTPFSASNFLSINSRMIANADTMELCATYFSTLLQELDYSNPKNYILRSLSFDSKDVQSDLLKTTSDFFNSHQVPTFGFAFTQLFDEKTLVLHQNYRNQVSSIQATIKQNIDILSEQLGGTMARVFHGRINQFPNSAKTIAMKSFEAFSGKVLTRKEVSGKLGNVVETILKESKIDFDGAGRQAKKKAKDAVRVNIKKSILESFNADPDLKRLQKMNTKVYVVSIIDYDKMSTITPKMSQQQIGDIFSDGVMRTPAQVLNQTQQVEEATSLGRYRQGNQSIFARSGTGFGFGVFAFALQSIALMDAGRSAATNFKSQAGVQFVGMIVSAFGGIADVYGRQLVMKFNMLSANGSSSSLDLSKFEIRKDKWIKWSARGLYAGAVILAGVELYKAYGAWQKDQTLIASLYITNGFLIVMSTHAFVRGTAIWALGLRASYWGIILVAVMVLIGYGISLAERRAVRKYLEGSAWGIAPEQWSIEEDSQAFKNIYEGDDK